jgi:hypothetical protein
VRGGGGPGVGVVRVIGSGGRSVGVRINQMGPFVDRGAASAASITVILKNRNWEGTSRGASVQWTLPREIKVGVYPKKGILVP